MNSQSRDANFADVDKKRYRSCFRLFILHKNIHATFGIRPIWAFSLC